LQQAIILVGSPFWVAQTIPAQRGCLSATGARHPFTAWSARLCFQLSSQAVLYPSKGFLLHFSRSILCLGWLRQSRLSGVVWAPQAQDLKLAGWPHHTIRFFSCLAYSQPS